MLDDSLLNFNLFWLFIFISCLLIHLKEITKFQFTFKSIKKVAATGIDRISIGSITHSATAVDLKLEI